MKLIIIDGHAILYRAYYALPSLTTSKGELVNAVFGFISMLLRVVSDLHPTHMVVTFDRPKPTFRKKMYKEYQATRPEMAKELAGQIELVHKVVNIIRIPIYEMDGYEADDVIATLAKQALCEQRTKKNLSTLLRVKEQGTEKEIIIVTGDRDLLQLVSDKVKIYMPVKGLSKSKLFGEREVEEKYGVRPEQMVDYKALVGDQSDNYPGVAGIGPKTASSLLSRFKTLEEIYRNLGKLESKKTKEVLEESEKSAEMAKKLAVIVTDVPVKFNLEKSRLPNFDRPDIHWLFEELGFRSLISRLSTSNNNKQITKNKEQKIKNKEQKKEKKELRDKNEQIKLF